MLRCLSKHSRMIFKAQLNVFLNTVEWFLKNLWVLPWALPPYPLATRHQLTLIVALLHVTRSPLSRSSARCCKGWFLKAGNLKTGWPPLAAYAWWVLVRNLNCFTWPASFIEMLSYRAYYTVSWFSPKQNMIIFHSFWLHLNAECMHQPFRCCCSIQKCHAEILVELKSKDL